MQLRWQRTVLLTACITMASAAHAGSPDVTFTVVNNGFGAWTIDGNDNPPLTLLRGKTYAFALQGVGAVHPFNINTIDTIGAANQYNVGVTNNGATGNAVLTFEVPVSAPDTLHYNCANHAAMNGPITIINDELFANGFD